MQQNNLEQIYPTKLPSFQFGRDDKSSLETLIKVSEGESLPAHTIIDALRSLGPEKLRKIYEEIPSSSDQESILGKRNKKSFEDEDCSPKE